MHENFILSIIDFHSDSNVFSSIFIKIMNRFFIAEQPVNTVCEFKENISLKDLLEELRPFPVAPTRLTVSRSSILSDSVSIFKQKSFDSKSHLK